MLIEHIEISLYTIFFYKILFYYYPYLYLLIIFKSSKFLIPSSPDKKSILSHTDKKPIPFEIIHIPPEINEITIFPISTATKLRLHKSINFVIHSNSIFHYSVSKKRRNPDLYFIHMFIFLGIYQ